MSTTLAWYEVLEDRVPLGRACFTLKDILSKRFTDHDGSMPGSFRLTTAHISFIEGLVAAGVEDSGKLLKDLRERRAVDVEIV